MAGKITNQELSPELNAKIDKTTKMIGTANFNSTTGTIVSHDIGHMDYYVNVTPSANAAGYLGEIWVEYASTNFKVLNTGSAKTPFKYSVIV